MVRSILLIGVVLLAVTDTADAGPFQRWRDRRAARHHGGGSMQMQYVPVQQYEPVQYAPVQYAPVTVPAPVGAVPPPPGAVPPAGVQGSEAQPQAVPVQQAPPVVYSYPRGPC